MWYCASDGRDWDFMTQETPQHCASKSSLEGKYQTYFHTLLDSKLITGNSKPKQANGFYLTHNESLEFTYTGGRD